MFAAMSRGLRRQGGFSLAELIVAFGLFTASVVGVAVMMVGGGAGVTRGAMDTQAANLASRQVEKVRSLPFYKPYDMSVGDQDIDDFYFNTAVSNANQLANPGTYGVEQYGTISGFPKFKRTTTVQYQYVNAGNTNLETALMYNSPPRVWVPKYPTGDQIDRPTGGATATTDENLRAILVEVKVYFQTDYGEKIFTERALCGDLMVTGGSNNPVLVVTSIDPTSGALGDTHCNMTIYVDAVGLNASSTLQVKLWYAGRNDIVANNAVANAAGSQITCWFDLGSVTPGVYNLSVYWQDEGWEDKSFRDCFTVIAPPPRIDSVANFNWGYRAQSARQITVTGMYLTNPSMVRVRWPQNGTPTYICTGSVVSSNITTIVANINLTTVPNDPAYWNARWAVEVTTLGGTDLSNGDGERILVNPRPVVTSIQDKEGAAGDPDFYRKKQYGATTVIYGRYFQGTGTQPTVALTKSGQTNVPCTSGSVTEVSDTDTRINLTNLDLRLSGDGGPMGWGDGTNEIGDWRVAVSNQDGQANSENVYGNVAHAPIAVTVTGNTSGYYNQWDQSIGTITGNYFQTGAGGTKVTYWIGGTCYDPWGGVYTIQNGQNPTIGGAYGTGQTLSAMTYNFISIPAGWGWINVQDQENGQMTGYSFEIQYMSPQLLSYSLASGNNGTTYNGVVIQTRGAYTGGGIYVNMSGPGYYNTCNHWALCWCCNNTGDSPWTGANSTNNVLTENRSGKQVYLTHSILLPAKSGSWSHSHTTIWPFTCSHSGINFDPTTRADDVNALRLYGNWGNVSMDPAINIL